MSSGNNVVKDVIMHSSEEPFETEYVVALHDNHV